MCYVSQWKLAWWCKTFLHKNIKYKNVPQKSLLLFVYVVFTQVHIFAFCYVLNIRQQVLIVFYHFVGSVTITAGGWSVEAAVLRWKPFRLCWLVPMICTQDSVCFEVDSFYIDAIVYKCTLCWGTLPVPHPSELGRLSAFLWDKVTLDGSKCMQYSFLNTLVIWSAECNGQLAFWQGLLHGFACECLVSSWLQI